MKIVLALCIVNQLNILCAVCCESIKIFYVYMENCIPVREQRLTIQKLKLSDAILTMNIAQNY